VKRLKVDKVCEKECKKQHPSEKKRKAKEKTNEKKNKAQKKVIFLQKVHKNNGMKYTVDNHLWDAVKKHANYTKVNCETGVLKKEGVSCDGKMMNAWEKNFTTTIRKQRKTLKHEGEHCWEECGGRNGQGPCPKFCGSGFCCRKGAEYATNGCNGTMGNKNHHTCVKAPAKLKSNVTNFRKPCWKQCGHKSGPCPNFCGKGICCRKGVKASKCDGKVGITGGHTCSFTPTMYEEEKKKLARNKCLKACKNKCPDLSPNKKTKVYSDATDSKRCIYRADNNGFYYQGAARVAKVGNQHKDVKYTCQYDPSNTTNHPNGYYSVTSSGGVCAGTNQLEGDRYLSGCKAVDQAWVIGGYQKTRRPFNPERKESPCSEGWGWSPKPCKQPVDQICQKYGGENDESWGHTFGKGSGLLAFLGPYIQLSLKAQAGVNFGLLSMGVGVAVQLIKVQLLIVGDLMIAGDWSKNCVSLSLTIASGGGRVYLYLDTIFTDQVEFDLYSWDGLTYQWPDEKRGEFFGTCAGIKAAGDLDPMPGKDVLNKKCWVGIYGQQNFGGKPRNKVFVPTDDTGGVWYGPDSSPDEYSGNRYWNLQSIKLKGQCSRVELIANKPGIHGGTYWKQKELDKYGDSNEAWKWNAYWSQKSAPYHIKQNVFGFRVFPKAPLPASVPATIGQECTLTVYANTWYRGTKKVYKSSNVMGQKFVWGARPFSPRSWVATGFCDAILFYSQKVHVNGGYFPGCIITNPKNKLVRSTTDPERPDKFGDGDTEADMDKDKSGFCGALVYTKPPKPHTNIKCPNRHSKVFKWKKDEKSMKDKTITKENTFCQEQAFELEENKSQLGQRKASYIQKLQTDAIVSKHKIEFKQQWQNAKFQGYSCTDNSGVIGCTGDMCKCSGTVPWPDQLVWKGGKFVKGTEKQPHDGECREPKSGDSEGYGNSSPPKNFRKDCWDKCGGKKGQGKTCTFCGTGLCCRWGWKKNGCNGKMGLRKSHTCVPNPKQTKCYSKVTPPTEAGKVKCSQCGKPCPKGTKKVMVEKVTIGKSTGGKKTVKLCGAKSTTLRCPAIVDKDNWLTEVPADREGVLRSSEDKFDVKVGNGEVTVTKRFSNQGKKGSQGWNYDLSFNCMKCVKKGNGPIRKEVQAYDRVRRTSHHISFQSFSRIQLFPNLNKDWSPPSTWSHEQKSWKYLNRPQAYGMGIKNEGKDCWSDCKQFFYGSSWDWKRCPKFCGTGFCAKTGRWDEDRNYYKKNGFIGWRGNSQHTCIRDSNYFKGTEEKKRIDKKSPWCLEYFTKSGKKTDSGRWEGDGWGLFVAPCHKPPLKKRDAQKFSLDPHSKQLQVISRSGATKCVTQLPRDYHGTFWPGDPKFKKGWGDRYLVGRYITVDNCKPVGSTPNPENSDRFGCGGNALVKKEGKDKSGVKCDAITPEGQIWNKIAPTDCSIKNPKTGKYVKSTPSNKMKMKKLYKSMGLSLTSLESRCAYKLQNERTKLCLALYPTASFNNVHSHSCKKCSYDWAKQYWLPNGTGKYKKMKDHIIVGSAICDSVNVFRYRDQGDGTIRKGEIGHVATGLTNQQKYQWALLPKASKKRSQLLTVIGTTKEKTAHLAHKAKAFTAILKQSDVEFSFVKGDRVHAGTEEFKNTCTVGVVQTCWKIKPSGVMCSVKFGYHFKNIPGKDLSPADQDWGQKLAKAAAGVSATAEKMGKGKGKMRR
jgi:hypothetical protein